MLANIFTADAAGNLYNVDTATGTAVLIGTMPKGTDQIGSADSFNQTGTLYGTDGVLYQINPSNASATQIGTGVGTTLTALATSTTGVIYGANTALYTLSTITGGATLVGNLNLPDQIDPDTNQVYADTVSGDLCYDNGILYLTAHIHDETAGDDFFSVNTTTGAATLIGSIGLTNVTGLALGQDGVMYAVTAAGQLLSVNTTTGAGSFLSTISAGGMTDASAVVLPPAPPLTPPAASFTSSYYSADLNGVAATLTVQLTGGTATSEVDVSYNTVDDSAVAGTDYVAESGDVVFPVGVTTEQLTIPILNSESLGANKDFYVELTDPYTDDGSSSSTDIPYVLVDPSVAVVTIQNVNSAFEISPDTVSVVDNQPTATVTVQRLGVSSDEETVDFSTVYPTSAAIGTQAQPSVNYDTVLTTLVFLPGVTTQTVQIPILDATSNVGSSENALLQLSNPKVLQPATGSATAQNLFLLGSPNASLAPGTGLLTITNANSSAPSIEGITLNHVGKKITSISVQFSEPVSQTSAQALSSYGIFNRNDDGPFATGPRTNVKLSVISYYASTNTAVLTPAKPLAMNKVYQFVAYASGGVTDLSGHAILGNGTATANYSIFFGLGNNLNYVDADGDKVTLKLAGPGLLDLRRAFNGDASSLILDGTSPESILSGKLVKGKYGDGLTTIDLVGPAGGVDDELTKPPFIIVQLD